MYAGVYDAIKNQYLQTLLFGIATNVDGTSLLEVSSFLQVYYRIKTLLRMRHLPVKDILEQISSNRPDCDCTGAAIHLLLLL